MKTTEKIVLTGFILSGIITILILVIILSYILSKGLAVIDLEFLFSNTMDSGREGGIFPMIVTSIYLVILTAIIATPIGVGSAVYISQYCRCQKLIKTIRFASQTLASIPSIIYGLFGFAFFVLFLKMGWSILSGALVLSIMALPTIFQVSEVSLNAVDRDLSEASLGLGASKSQTILSVILPIAMPGILTGVVLAITRAISEAAAVMYVVGSSFEVPISIFDMGRPLPLHLYLLASEGVSVDNAYGTAAVLIVIVLLITFLSNYMVNKYQRRLCL